MVDKEKNINYPLVTVNILSFNRKEELRVTLTKVFEQDYKNIEVIVVDNASSDGTQEMVKTEFPEVKLIELKENIGIEAYNMMMKKAKGEYYLILDDDSYPEISALAYGISFLEKNQEYSIITFQIINSTVNEIETENYKYENPFHFHGCGTIWRSEVFKKLGGYDPDYFLYYNEIDLTIRCYNNNMRVRYLPEKLIYHKNIVMEKDAKRIKYHQHKIKYEQYFTGHFRFLIKHFNYKYVIVYGLKWVLNRLIVAIAFNYYKSFIKSLIRLPYVISSSKKNRNPVSNEIQKYYGNGNKPLIDRDFFPNFKRLP